MLEGLRDNERKEARDIVQALDSAGFVLSGFDKWRRAEGFQSHDVTGMYYTFKGIYGYFQIESAILEGRNMVVRCDYIPYTDTDKAYALETEGVSASGKSLSKKDLELLKAYRYKLIEYLVTAAIEELTGQRAEPNMKLRDDLGLEEDLDIPEITMILEDKYDCIISDEDAKHFETVADVISFIRKAEGMSSPPVPVMPYFDRRVL